MPAMLRKQPDAYGVSIYEELEKRLKSGGRLHGGRHQRRSRGRFRGHRNDGQLYPSDNPVNVVR